MAANIRSTVLEFPAGPIVGAPLTNQSREDISRGNQILLESVDVATTYSWSLSFTPESTGGGPDPFEGATSSAVLLPPEGSTSQTAKFNVDFEGSYLVRLVVDASLPTEDVKYIRFRYLTEFGSIKLVAAGERRDQNGTIPVDADAAGWANDQNRNLQRLLLLVRRLSTSGRCLFVDANRGRDASNTPNDKTVTITIPGTDLSNLEDTGIEVSANAFADFSTVSDAIAYALDAGARGEAALSADEPYFIFVQPGLYEENVIFQPFVHVIGQGVIPSPAEIYRWNAGGDVDTLIQRSVVIRATNNLGLTHTFAPGDPPEDAQVFISRVILENLDDTTTPLLDHQGGLLILKDCVLIQGGDDPAQGPVLSSVSAGIVDRPSVEAEGSTFWMRATTVGQFAVILDSAKSDWQFSKCVFWSLADGIQVNPSLYGGLVVGDPQDSRCTLRDCQLTASGATSYGIWAYPTELNIINSDVTSNGLTDTLVIEGFGGGVGAKGGDVDVVIDGCRIFGSVQFDTTQAAGSTSLRFGTTLLQLGALTFPGGSPTNVTAGAHAKTLRYVDDYNDPVTGTPVVPVLSRLGVNSVQDAIDLLVQLLLPLGIAPYYSLETAYNGLLTVNPPVAGSGLGRTITADDGSVQIEGAPLTTGSENSSTDGSLQVEGFVDIGGFSPGQEGSEINLHPNLTGTGPTIRMGRSVVTDDAGVQHRGINSATIIARQHPVSGYLWNLRARTLDVTQSGTGSAGHAILEGGLSLTPDPAGASPSAGPVVIQAGDYRNTTPGGLPGDVMVSPGASDAGDPDGRFYLVNPSASTPTTLETANVFVGGVDGNIYFATANGFVMAAVGSGDAIGTVAATLDALDGISCSVSGGTRLLITTDQWGPNADVHFISDDQGGALNTALGDFSISGGATYTQGTFAETVGMACVAPNTLQVFGSLIANTTLNRVRIDVGDSPYSVPDDVNIVGVDTSAGPSPIQVVLPDSIVAGGVDGRVLYINDELNNAGTVNIELSIGGSGRIDLSAGPLNIATNGGGVTLYCAGDTGGFIDWYVLP